MSTQPLPTPPRHRMVLLVVFVLAALVAITALLMAADTALSVWERLRGAPAWLAWPIAVVLVAAVAIGARIAWRLWRGPARVPPRAAATRDDVEARIARLAGRAPQAWAQDELAELDARAQGEAVHVALFGDVSSGKTSLVRALAGRDDLAVDVRAGTTRDVVEASAQLPDGRTVVLADAPGLDEAGGAERAALARAEATRAHALVYVCDGDVTRTQDAELARVLAWGKPVVIAVNKTDRYGADERRALRERLHARYGDRALVVEVVAGGAEELLQRDADGRETRVVRERPPELAALRRALAELTAPGAAALEPARRAAVLGDISARLEAEEAVLRAQDADAIVARYTRRAIVGALAAVAPGSDIVIQGALATAMLRELTRLHGLGLRHVDLDAFVARAGATARTSSALALAIVGNALKAFPGLGTIGGGAVHAVAYGLIFDSLGHAVAQTLAERKPLDDAAVQRFATALREPGTPRVGALLRLARDTLRDPRPEDGR
jgi:uncharacterized protein